MPINELEFESAICRCFSLLLPDMANAGFSIESHQAVLHGRRLDLVLQRDSAERIIVELKVGAPPVGPLLDQVLEYKKCYESTYPERPLQLMVVSTRIPDGTRRSLQAHGIQALVISEEEVLSALQVGLPSVAVRKGINLDGEERVQEIRRILSDESISRVPEGTALEAPWNQFKVFLALLHIQNQKPKAAWMKSPYVQLYPQPERGNAALLYHVSVKSASLAPIHIRKDSVGWREDYWKRIEHCLTYAGRDKGKPTVFDHYAVKEWDSFARALGLDDRH